MKKYRSLRVGFEAIALAALLFPVDAFGQPADTEKSGADGSASLEFLNYQGPYARVETRAQIAGVGTALGSALENSAGAGTMRLGDTARYFVIHPASGDGDGDGLLNADIFGIGVDAGVDHIRNLRLIIQGYLEAAYAYSERDAALLAEYITVYNAAFRGNRDYFSGRYKTEVMRYVDREKAGLSLRFDEWPGRTHILIPLNTGRYGTLSAVDTASLTVPEVIGALRSRDDKGIDPLKAMANLKEREAEEAEAREAAKRDGRLTAQKPEEAYRERRDISGD
jgi:hypothetical protein